MLQMNEPMLPRRETLLQNASMVPRSEFELQQTNGTVRQDDLALPQGKRTLRHGKFLCRNGSLHCSSVSFRGETGRGVVSAAQDIAANDWQA
jgi:hypothetical protein